MSNLARLLQLASPQLPVGGFAYSRGLELAIDRGWVTDVSGTRTWVEGLLGGGAKNVDAPLVARLFDAWATGDLGAVRQLTELDLAWRETAELRAESLAMGRALSRLVGSLADHSPDALRVARRSYHAAFALAGHAWGVSRRETVLALLWTWLEATVMAAVKLVPLGQTDGQRILYDVGADLDAAVDHALTVGDDDLGTLQPGLAIASSLHETQHTRLFRS